MAIERRIQRSGCELRVNGSGEDRYIEGYAAVFNSRSDNLGGFQETIEPGAFRDVLETDVVALFNHDPNFILGRRSADTLELAEDDHGLSFRSKVPDGQLVRDLVVGPIERGELTGTSFGFLVAAGGDSFSRQREGLMLRTITKFRELRDIGPATFPAYPDTSVAVRSLNAWLESHPAQEREMVNDELTADEIVDLLAKAVEVEPDELRAILKRPDSSPRIEVLENRVRLLGG